MGFLKDLGLDKYLLLAQIVNFFILFFVLKAFFYKPLKKVLDERKEKISKGLQDADFAKALLENTAREKGVIIKSARLEVQSMIEHSKNIAQDIRYKMVEDARNEAAKVLQDAQKEAELEMQKMNKQIKGMSLDLSKKMLENVMPVLLDESQKAEVLKRALKKLEEKNLYE